MIQSIIQEEKEEDERKVALAFPWLFGIFGYFLVDARKLVGE